MTCSPMMTKRMIMRKVMRRWRKKKKRMARGVDLVSLPTGERARECVEGPLIGDFERVLSQLTW